MFNVRPEALIPWLHVEPPLADEVPGFRMNPDGSVRDTQRDAASGSFGFGMPPGTLTPRYADAIQPLVQPVLGFLAPSSDFSAQPALGLARLRAEPQHDALGFNFGLGVNPFESGSSMPRQETPWSGETPPGPPQYSDSAPMLRRHA